MRKLSPKQKLKQELIDDLWHQIPLPGYVGTYGPCNNKCGRTARGGGICRSCIIDRLAKLSTMQKAVKLEQEITRFRKTGINIEDVKVVERLIMSNRRL